MTLDLEQLRGPSLSSCQYSSGEVCLEGLHIVWVDSPEIINGGSVVNGDNLAKVNATGRIQFLP